MKDFWNRLSGDFSRRAVKEDQVMKIKIIHNAQELETLAPFYVDQLLWGTKSIPKTYGYIGFVPGDAFYLKMICEESEPLCTYTHDLDPVYRDSAMEAFFQFEPRINRLQAIYLNFETNCCGALLAGFGKERAYRSYFSKEIRRKLCSTAKVEKDRWIWDLRVPVDVLEEVYGPLHLEEGSSFTCNFYKISETKEIEHYASYAPIHSPIPSFHLTEFFETAVIER